MQLISMLRETLIGRNQQSPFSLNHFPQRIVCHAFVFCAAKV